MSTYAIGDVQGCYRSLLALLAHIGFRSGQDQLWFAGDLVNRGPDSLAVLRFVRALGDGARVVLGNHDLHLVAASRGHRKPSRKDTLDDVLGAGDGPELIEWLLQQPLLYEDLGVAMVHAGLPPRWAWATARDCADELSAVLRDDGRLDAYLAGMYGDRPLRWSDALTGQKRLRYITNAFTRMRYVDGDGELELEEKRPPGEQPSGLVPWFASPHRRNRGQPILFGHWATLRLHAEVDPAHGVHHLDTGCVWGGRLTALRLEDRVEFSVPGPQPP
jgi:bis(5'-nucleosyl)-tetraphosphatase (symmetrical)